MNHYSRRALSLLAAALITGCASQATLHIHSEPQGAYISDESGRLLGTTPVALNYALDGNATNCVETGNLTAHWVSGVEEEIGSVLLCETGYTSTLITRDFSQPGLAEDREFAVQLEMLELQQAQTRATQDAAEASWAAAAAVRDAAYAARWSGRSGYRQNQDRDRYYSDHDGDRSERSDDRERADRRTRDPDSSAANVPAPAQDPAGQADDNTANLPIYVGASDTNQITDEVVRAAALQEEQTQADQTAAEQPIVTPASAEEEELEELEEQPEDLSEESEEDTQE